MYEWTKEDDVALAKLTERKDARKKAIAYSLEQLFNAQTGLFDRLNFTKTILPFIEQNGQALFDTLGEFYSRSDPAMRPIEVESKTDVGQQAPYTVGYKGPSSLLRQWDLSKPSNIPRPEHYQSPQHIDAAPVEAGMDVPMHPVIRAEIEYIVKRFAEYGVDFGAGFSTLAKAYDAKNVLERVLMQNMPTGSPHEYKRSIGAIFKKLWAERG